MAPVVRAAAAAHQTAVAAAGEEATGARWAPPAGSPRAARWERSGEKGGKLTFLCFA